MGLNTLLLVALVTVMTAMWPINKFATERGARPEALGLVTSFSGLILSVGYLLAAGAGWGNWKVWLLGLLGGFAYAMGFFVLITACLKIGPTGLTTVMNNMGLIGPVLIGLIFFDEARNFSLWTGVGFSAILTSLVLIAAKTSGKRRDVSLKWFRMAFGGWLLSCMSLGCQYLSSRVDPNSYLLCSVAYFVSAFLILLALTFFRFRSGPGPIELLAGIPSGLLASLETPLSMYLVARLRAVVLYPISVTLPMLLVLLISKIFFKERLGWTGGLACVLGTAGIVLLNL